MGNIETKPRTSLLVSDILSSGFCPTNPDTVCTSGSDSVNTSDKTKCSSDLTSVLAANGVERSTATDDEVSKCVTYLNDDKFWPRQYQLHPNAKRVKNWLWTHSRFRKQADVIVDLVKQNPNRITKIHRLFAKLESKIVRHSKFENEQLFAFFRENSAKLSLNDGGSKLLERLDELEKDHKGLSDPLHLEGVQACHKDYNHKGRALISAITAWRQQLEEHLEMEEETLVGIWLNLSPENYAKYRTYLSWIYAAMY